MTKPASHFRYERGTQPVIGRMKFLHRLRLHAGYGAIVVALSLAIGVAGFMTASHESFVDALLNASMLLGGMGPVGDLGGTAGKLFASMFALYAGLVFLVLAGLFLAPVFHRVLHRFHWETQQKE